jgi:Tfp pilus assembly protein PilN
LWDASPPDEILACETRNGHVEIYGESPARPILSAGSDLVAERAAALAGAELRLEPGTTPQSFEQLLGVAPALPHAAALLSACPRLTLPLNLLPVEQRHTSSRAPWIAAAALGSGVLLLAGGLAAFPQYESRVYLRSLDAQIAALEPKAKRAAALDHEIDATRQRMALLDNVRGHTKADMDLLGELTRILPPPTWVNQLEISPTQVNVSGETDQAAPLLKVIDASPLLEASEFGAPPSRGPAGTELFRIRSNREPGK